MVKNDAIKMMKKHMTKDSIKRAEKQINEELVQMRLKELRMIRNINQESISMVSQSAISHFENRKNMYLSSLITYLQNIGMGVEIKAYEYAKLKKKFIVLSV